jgi:hypothetical protein
MTFPLSIRGSLLENLHAQSNQQPLERVGLLTGDHGHRFKKDVMAVTPFGNITVRRGNHTDMVTSFEVFALLLIFKAK